MYNYARRVDGDLERHISPNWVPPKEIRDVPIMLAVRNSSGALERVGSAFLVRIPFAGSEEFEHVYIVTARHCVMSASFAPRALVAEANWMGQQGGSWHDISANGWTTLTSEHVEFPVDLACRPYTGPSYSGHVIGRANWAISYESIVDCRRRGYEDDVPIGLETATAGLLIYHRSSSQIEPAVLFGRLALVPYELPQSDSWPADIYLVEGNATSGMSGAPVFIRDDEEQDGLALLGVHVGHYQEQSGDGTVLSSHSGLTTVVPAPYILNLFEAAPSVMHREHVVEAYKRAPWRFLDRRHRERNGLAYAQERFPNETWYLEDHVPTREYLFIVEASRSSEYNDVKDWWNEVDVGTLGTLDEVLQAFSKWIGDITWWTPNESGRGESLDGEFMVKLYCNSHGEPEALHLVYEMGDAVTWADEDETMRCVNFANSMGWTVIGQPNDERIN